MNMAIARPREAEFAGLPVPGWVPQGAVHYLAHTELGHPIRALARQAGVHASTILRQIRRLETRRDDPLIDAALRRLGAWQSRSQTYRYGPITKETAPMTGTPPTLLPDDATLSREAYRILRRLCETGAVLAVAAEMEKAVVVRDTSAGAGARTAVVDASVAQAMALKEWIAPANTGRIVRYHITTAGRAELDRLMKTSAKRGVDSGFAESQTAFEHESADAACATNIVEMPSRRIRYALAESPLAALARRRDKQGTPFLEDALVHAGERLREDFELAQMGPNVTQNWDNFLTAGVRGGGKPGNTAASGPSAARARVAAAFNDLGPGLSDVVLRCCCHLEGLETAEKRLGWSARSGKIVLRIALMRLQRHYEETFGPDGPMIG